MINRIIMLILVFLLPFSAVAQEKAVPQSQGQVKLSFAPLVKKVAPAVVNIYTKRVVEGGFQNPFLSDPFFGNFFREDFFGGQMREQVENSLGSGVILQANGLIVTNAHVVRGADEITVGLADGREFEADPVLRDDASDLALLRIREKELNLPFVTLNASETLEVGDLVLAIGNPFGVGQTVTSGIVSAQGRSSLDINDFNFFIQTDAAINPGNSGGPLVDMDGNVVGINTAIFSRSGGSMGIGFAIPSEMVASVVAAENSGQVANLGVLRPWLGASVQDVTQDIASSLGLEKPAGAMISALHSASPLQTAGVKVGDIVLSVDGKPIRDSAEMKFRMATVPIGGVSKIIILRNGETYEMDVAAIAPPDDPPREQMILEGNNPLNGLTIANLNPAVSAELEIKGEEQGVVIVDIPARTRMGRIISVGDILLDINGVEIQKTSDVQAALETTSAEPGFSLTILRDGRTSRIYIR